VTDDDLHISDDELEQHLRGRALERGCEFIVERVETTDETHWRAVFKQLVDSLASEGIILLASEAPERRRALLRLLELDERRS
jgi:hypothetical protein